MLAILVAIIFAIIICYIGSVLLDNGRNENDNLMILFGGALTLLALLIVEIIKWSVVCMFIIKIIKMIISSI